MHFSAFLVFLRSFSGIKRENSYSFTHFLIYVFSHLCILEFGQLVVTGWYGEGKERVSTPFEKC